MQLPKIEVSSEGKVSSGGNKNWKTGCITVGVTWFLNPIVTTLSGAFTGWVVGLLFSAPILLICGQFGIHDVSVLQIGLFLGFVAGFFK